MEDERVCKVEVAFGLWAALDRCRIVVSIATTSLWVFLWSSILRMLYTSAQSGSVHRRS